MEHIAWKGRIKPGCKAEYQRRHAEIWPEMVEVLKAAGICNYSIFYCNDELFGYYECAKGVAYAEKVQAESPVVDRWNDYMKDILELEMDPVTGAQLCCGHKYCLIVMFRYVIRNGFVAFAHFCIMFVDSGKNIIFCHGS